MVTELILFYFSFPVIPMSESGVEFGVALPYYRSTGKFQREDITNSVGVEVTV